MRRHQQCGWLLLTAVLAIGDAPAALGKDDFAAAKVGIARQLMAKDPDVRAAGMRRLQAFPQVEAADLIVKKGLKDADAGVRFAAYESLLAMKDELPVCEFLLAQLDREAKRKNGHDLSPAVLAVVLASDAPSARNESLKLVDDVLSTSPEGMRILNGLADDLALHASMADVPALVRLSQSIVFLRDFGLRRGVVHALCKIPHADAISALIGLLPKCEGLVQADIVVYLTSATGQSHERDAAAWAKWWQESKASFRYAAVQVPAAGGAPAASESSSYYGLPLYAGRLVFVIDTSGSMHGGKLEAAQRELNSTIAGLPETAQFSVVAFHSKVTPWQKQLMPATAANKQGAIAFVTRLTPEAKTATYDALEIAFQFDAEAIYLLTDGVPGGGRVDAIDEIVKLVGKANLLRRESINTIGIGVGAEGGKFEWFLKALAEQNYGTFRRVDR